MVAAQVITNMWYTPNAATNLVPAVDVIVELSVNLILVDKLEVVSDVLNSTRVEWPDPQHLRAQAVIALEGSHILKNHLCQNQCF